MNAKTLGTLGVAAVALAAVAVLVHRSGQPGGAEADLGPLSPGLTEGINQARALVVEQGGERMEFRRGEDGGWSSPAPDGFPVMADRVREVLIQLARLEKKDALTSKPERWAALQLDPPGPDSEARAVRLLGEGDATLLDLVVGKDKWGANPGVYVRLADEEQTWLCDGRLSLPRATSDWMERRVAQLAMADVATVVLERGGETLSVSRPEEEEEEADGGFGAVDWQLAELPEGRELTTPNPLGRIAGALGWLSFEDVRAAASVPTDGEPSFVARYTTTQEQQVVIRGWEHDGELWCRLEASFVGEEPAEEAAAAEEDPRDQVEEWNAQWQGWLYSFPATSADLWKSELESLLEPLPEPAEDEATETEGYTEPPTDGDGQG